MPRKRPREVRLDNELAGRWGLHIRIPGLSGRGANVLARLDTRRHMCPGRTAQILASYKRYLADPVGWTDVRAWSCGDPECCPGAADLPQLRAWLDAALHELPPRDRRLIRRQLRALDPDW